MKVLESNADAWTGKPPLPRDSGAARAVRCMGAPYPAMRTHGLAMTLRLGDVLDEDLVLSLLQDRDAEVRLKAIEVANDFALIRAVPSLIGLLEDEAETVAVEAAVALEAIGAQGDETLDAQVAEAALAGVEAAIPDGRAPLGSGESMAAVRRRLRRDLESSLVSLPGTGETRWKQRVDETFGPGRHDEPSANLWGEVARAEARESSRLALPIALVGLGLVGGFLAGTFWARRGLPAVQTSASSMGLRPVAFGGNPRPSGAGDGEHRPPETVEDGIRPSSGRLASVALPTGEEGTSIVFEEGRFGDDGEGQGREPWFDEGLSERTGLDGTPRAVPAGDGRGAKVDGASGESGNGRAGPDAETGDDAMYSGGVRTAVVEPSTGVRSEGGGAVSASGSGGTVSASGSGGTVTASGGITDAGADEQFGNEGLRVAFLLASARRYLAMGQHEQAMRMVDGVLFLQGDHPAALALKRTIEAETP